MEYTRKPDGATVISRFSLTAEANVADAVGALDHGGHGEQVFFVQQDGMDDVADGDADSEACAAFLFEDFSAAVFSAFEDGVLEASGTFGQPRQQESIDRR